MWVPEKEVETVSQTGKRGTKVIKFRDGGFVFVKCRLTNDLIDLIKVCVMCEGCEGCVMSMLFA